MIERLEFNTTNVKKINELLQEGLKICEENFSDPNYPREAPRKIVIEVVFEPEKRDPDDIKTLLFMTPKLPRRYGKKVNTVIRAGKILVEDAPEDEDLGLFSDKVTSIRKEPRND